VYIGTENTGGALIKSAFVFQYLANAPSSLSLSLSLTLVDSKTTSAGVLRAGVAPTTYCPHDDVLRGKDNDPPLALPRQNNGDAPARRRAIAQT